MTTLYNLYNDSSNIIFNPKWNSWVIFQSITDLNVPAAEGSWMVSDLWTPTDDPPLWSLILNILASAVLVLALTTKECGRLPSESCGGFVVESANGGCPMGLIIAGCWMVTENKKYKYYY